jgi:hypothetical protein
MPDALRLHSAEDRAAFRQWFWRLAEMQTELPEAERAGEVQDCAALLRYAYREALKVHDASGLRRSMWATLRSSRCGSGGIRRRCWGQVCFGCGRGRWLRETRATGPSCSLPTRMR